MQTFGLKRTKLTGRSYITVEAWTTTNTVELIDKKEFANMAMDKNSETFVMHVAFTVEIMSIHLA